MNYCNYCKRQDQDSFLVLRGGKDCDVVGYCLILLAKRESKIS